MMIYDDDDDHISFLLIWRENQLPISKRMFICWNALISALIENKERLSFQHPRFSRDVELIIRNFANYKQLCVGADIVSTMMSIQKTI